MSLAAVLAAWERHLRCCCGARLAVCFGVGPEQRDQAVCLVDRNKGVALLKCVSRMGGHQHVVTPREFWQASGVMVSLGPLLPRVWNRARSQTHTSSEGAP